MHYDDQCVCALERQFPKIVTSLTVLWGDRDLQPYLDKLVVDDRGDREGFPQDVMQELLFLSRLHAAIVPVPDSDNPIGKGMRIR
jgi:uncharacterized protein